MALSFSLNLPTCWAELGDDDLRCLQRMTAAGTDIRTIRTHLVLARIPKRLHRRMDPLQLGVAVQTLAFLDNPPDYPVRPEKMRRKRALPAEFHGVTFSDYLTVENYYQGFLRGQRIDTAAELLACLYPGYRQRKPEPAEILAAVHWMVGLKALFARTFRVLFGPADDTGEPDMRQAMDAQIRALTGGDVTKEREVLDTDTWRALTELDAIAREARRIKELRERKK